MSKLFLCLVISLLCVSVSQSQTVQSFEGWIAYPMMNYGEVYSPNQIGFINPATGEERQIFAGYFSPESLTWSSDYTKLIFWKLNLYSIDLLSEEITQVTHEQEVAYYAASPDGSIIAYLRREDKNHLIVMDMNGNPLYDIADRGIALTPLTFSPDSRFLIFQGNNEDLPKLYSLNILSGEIAEIVIQEDDGAVIDSGVPLVLFSRYVKYSDTVVVDFRDNIAVRINNPNFFEWSSHFVLDNQYLLFSNQSEDGMYSSLRLLNTETREIIDIDTGNLMGHDVSPDGQMLVYMTRGDADTKLCTVSLISLEPSCLDVDVFFYGTPAWSS